MPPLIRLAPAIGAIDLPDARKVHQQAIPRIGGIAMIIGAVLPVAFLLPLDNEVLALLLGFGILLFFGIWDDRANLHYRIKFIGQLLAVLVVIFLGDVVVRDLPFFNTPLPDYIAIPFTIFALVGITNAINLSDGLDGLAGGTTLLSFCMIGLLAYKSSGFELLLICMAVAGSIIGFLRHNTYPARIFMGDTGSQFLGFSAGVLVIMLSQQVNTAMSPVVPLILLGLPILDTIAVMGQRIYEGKSPFTPDKNHIHHKLLAVGFDHYEAVFVIYVVQTILVAMAYFMRYEDDALIFTIYLAFSVIVLYLFHYARKTGWRVHKKGENNSKFKKMIVWLYSTGILERGPMAVMKLGIPLFFLGCMIAAQDIDMDMRWLSIGLLLVWLMAIWLHEQAGSFERIVTYVLCVVSVYLMETSIPSYLEYIDIVNVYFVLLAIAFAIKVRFSRDKSFQITPLDFLVVLLVIVIPNLQEFAILDFDIGEAAVKLIVLFYCTEAVLNVIKNKMDIFRLGVLASLVVITVRGFL